MKTAYKLILLILFLYLPYENVAQIAKSEIQRKTLQIIDSIENCSLITVDSLLQPRSRIMSPFPVDSTFTIWFGTHSKSRKVEQIKSHSKVTISYYNANTAEYVNLYGNGAIVNSEEEKEKWWKTDWVEFYPNRDVDYTLIKFTPVWVEVFSYSKGLISDRVTLKPLKFSIN